MKPRIQTPVPPKKIKKQKIKKKTNKIPKTKKEKP
jgi:hypothetical protein